MLAGALSSYSVQAARAGLISIVTTAALAKGAASGGSTLALLKGTLKMMLWSKTKSKIVNGAAALLTASTATVAVKSLHPATMDESLWLAIMRDTSKIAQVHNGVTTPGARAVSRSSCRLPCV